MMSHKIIDESHFMFHVVAKAKLIKLFTQLHLPRDQNWLKNDANDPVIAALLEILEEYKKVEPRANRAAVFIPVIEYAISLMANSLFFKKRGYWWIHQIIKRHEQFRHCVYFSPDETDDKGASIEQEYMDWYHVDVGGDLNFPDELKARLIQEGRQWMKDNDPNNPAFK
jgi:hypothetical protein